MKSWTNFVVLMAASLAWGQGVSGPASQPATQPVRRLRFEIAPASQAIRWDGEHSPEQIIHPTCAAVIALVQQTGAQWTEDRVEHWISSLGVELPGISAQQQAFIRQRIYATASSVQTHRLASGMNATYETQTFLAVSEQDARQMATLYIAYRDERVQHRLEEARRKLQASIEMLEQAPPRIKEYEALEKRALERIAALAGEPIIYTPAWQKAIDEGKAALKGLDIERTGQLARLRKIQEYLGERTTPRQSDRSPGTQPNPAVLTALETLLVELNVEMAGTQAKIDVVEKDIAPFRELLNIAHEKDDADQKRMDWSGRLEAARRNVEQLPQTLADPPSDMRPVQVKDDTVWITPVRPAPASEPSE